MLKTLLLVLAGLVAGFTIALWLGSGSQAPPSLTAAEPSGAAADSSRLVAAADGATAARLAALEAALDAEVDERAALEQRVAGLATQLQALGERPARAGDFPAAAGDGPNAAAVAEVRERFRRDPNARNAEADRRFAERLTATGFAPDRAEWIVQRAEQLRMEALQAQYDARRSGRPVEMDATDQTLRAELGEADYERYLEAYGRPTTIPVRDVLASSPAERSGLKPGDEIVAYAGQRVFELRELNELTLQGTPGESIVVEVRRDGQSLQLVLPRGPLGITGGGIRGR
jgi:hypothetical protein